MADSMILNLSGTGGGGLQVQPQQPQQRRKLSSRQRFDQQRRSKRERLKHSKAAGGAVAAKGAGEGGPGGAVAPLAGGTRVRTHSRAPPPMGETRRRRGASGTAAPLSTPQRTASKPATGPAEATAAPQGSAEEVDPLPGPKAGRTGGWRKGTTNTGTMSSPATPRPAFAASGRKDTVMSSLFTANPEIPDVQMPGAEPEGAAPIDLPLFSAKAFASVGIDAKLVKTLEVHLSATTLTTAQRMSFPAISAGRDVLVKSPTGTGKTLAYAVPLVQQLQGLKPRASRSDGPLALILTPTRELAVQTLEVLTVLLKPFVWIVPGAVMGGEKKKSEKARLRKGVNVLVATPGRMLDHIENTECLSLANVRWLVLDEADRLTDAGFEKDMKAILASLVGTAGQRQTVLVSATLTDTVKELAEMALRDPVSIDASKGAPADDLEEDDGSSSEDGDGNGGGSAAANTDEGQTAEAATYVTSAKLQQHFLLVPSKQRLVALVAFLKWKVEPDSRGKAVVFVASRDMATFFRQLLSSDVFAGNMRVSCLHGSMSQQERTKAFLAFCKSSRAIMVCTDVAARGLDLNRVKWIVHATAPTSVPEYIHRVGRTARIGESGQSLLMLLPSEADFVQVLHGSGQRLREMKLRDVLLSLSSGGSAKVSRRAPNLERAKQLATDLQVRFEAAVLQDSDLAQAARDAFSSFIKAYATYPAALKASFHINSLHLGHVAKSFALREAPVSIKQRRGKGAAAAGQAQGGKDRPRPKKGSAGLGRKLSKHEFHALSEEGQQLVRETIRKRKRAASGEQALIDEFVGGGLVHKPAKKRRRKASKVR